MFSNLAKFSIKFKLPIIFIWIALAVVLTIYAPRLSKVGVTDDSQFLPKTTESTRASDLLDEKFNGTVDTSASSSIIVIYNPDGLDENDMASAQDLHLWLSSDQSPQVISGTISVFDTPALSSTMISGDQTTMLIKTDLSQGSSSAASKESVAEIRDFIDTAGYDTDAYST